MHFEIFFKIRDGELEISDSLVVEAVTVGASDFHPISALEPYINMTYPGFKICEFYCLRRIGNVKGELVY